MQVKVQPVSWLKDYVNPDSLPELEENSTIQQLCQRLTLDCFEGLIFIVNGRLAGSDYRLKPGDIIEILSPLAGG